MRRSTTSGISARAGSPSGSVPAGTRRSARSSRRYAELAPARTLDVACGTGFLTRNLRGQVTGLDQSDQMIEIARERMPAAEFVQADAIPLPFAD